MDSVEASLAELYREALVIGSLVVSMAQKLPNERQVEEIEKLVARREALVVEAAERCNRGECVGEPRSVLAEVLQQQRVLEAEVDRLLSGIRAAIGESSTASVHLRDLQRLMGGARRSGMIDERR